MACQPTHSFHVVKLAANNRVNNISHIGTSGLWVNAGYFILRKEIFEYMHEGEELVNEPFQRLIEEEELVAYPYDGSWLTMDTFKEKQMLDDMYTRGDVPWEVWHSEEKHQKQSEQCLSLNSMA